MKLSVHDTPGKRTVKLNKVVLSERCMTLGEAVTFFIAFENIMYGTHRRRLFFSGCMILTSQEVQDVVLLIRSGIKIVIHLDFLIC